MIFDSREANPLPLPGVLDVLDPSVLPTNPRTIRVRIEPIRRGLEVADYVLAGDEGVVYEMANARGAAVVERKASVDEIGTNLFTPHRRPAFIRLLTRMRERWAHPQLLIEGGLTALFKPGHHFPPGIVIDGLQRLSMEYGVPIQLIDGRGLTQRAHVGEWVVRYLINGVLRGGDVQIDPDDRKRPTFPIPPAPMP